MFGLLQMEDLQAVEQRRGLAPVMEVIAGSTASVRIPDRWSAKPCPG